MTGRIQTWQSLVVDGNHFELKSKNNGTHLRILSQKFRFVFLKDNFLLLRRAEYESERKFLLSLVRGYCSSVESFLQECHAIPVILE